MTSKIIDAFCFFNEIELLEIRLNSLAPYVDTFVIVESDFTHAGNPKPLYFTEDCKRDPGRYSDFNINCVVLNASPEDIVDAKKDSWLLERAQREAILAGLSDAQPDDPILISDVDEFPDLATWDHLPGGFSQKLYYWYMNVLWNDTPWRGTVAVPFELLSSPNVFRDIRYNLRECGKGWHYSYLGGKEKIKEKIMAFAHQEHNTPEKLATIGDRMKVFSTPFCDSDQRAIGIVPLDGPEWLLRNRSRYEHLIKELP